MKIKSIRECPERIGEAANWFHEKWKVPVSAYTERMEAALHAEKGVPSWYMIENGEGKLIAGIGIIENDFHKRPDLTPNLCALYVEEPYRKKGLARALLDRACSDLAKCGVKDAYLITGHTALYERYGFDFFGMVEEDDGNMIRMYHKKTE